MTAIVFPHVCCNDGIITDLSGYGCIPGNLGLPELLNKKFDKTGGTIKANSKAIDIVTGATDSGYIQISDENGNAIHQIGKISSDKILTLRNVAEDGTLTISGDSVRFNGNLIAISATKYNDLTSSRNSNINYVNNQGHVIFVILQSAISANQYLTATVNDVSVTWAYAGPVEGTGSTATIPVPPGATYSASGFTKWIEVY